MLIIAWLISILYVPSERAGPVVAGVDGAEFAFWNEIDSVAVGGMGVVLGSSAGDAATATLTRVSNAALLGFPCGGREAIIDFNEGELP